VNERRNDRIEGERTGWKGEGGLLKAADLGRDTRVGLSTLPVINYRPLSATDRRGIEYTQSKEIMPSTTTTKS
jgi:hypothetical protein